MATQLQTADHAQAQVPALTPEGELFALRQRQARMFASSPLVPEHLRKGSPEQAIANCWIALTLAEAMGEVPLIVMQNIHVVSGKAGFASQYMIARANNSGIFKGRIDWRIDRSDPNNLAVTAYATIKESGQEVEVTCDMTMAQAEGWVKNPKYKTMPEVMLRYRSAAFLVRFYAPDVMLGYQTAEEVEDVAAAALPAAEPLTGQMLIDQSQPTLRATPAHDEDTGEVLEEEGEDQPDEQPQSPEVNDQDDSADAHEHPAQPLAGQIIAEVEAANAIIDVNSIEARHRLDIAAMPDELANLVSKTIDDRKEAIKAGREATKQTDPVQ